MKPKKKTRKRKNRGALWLVLGSAGLGVMAWAFFAGAGKDFTESGARLVPTMSPSYFSRDPRAQAAYQAEVAKTRKQ